MGLDSRASAPWLTRADDDDRSLRRQLELELAAERSAHRALLATTSDAVFDLDASGTVLACAGQVAPLTGTPPRQLVGTEFADLFSDRDVNRLGVLLIFAMTAPQNGEFALRGAAGAGRDCTVAVQALATAGLGLKLRAVVRDASAAALLEEQQRRAAELAGHSERLATLGQLAAGMAHEINNPLAFIKSNLSTLANMLEELALDDPEQRAEMSQMVAESLDGAERIRHLVDALRGTARQKVNESVAFDPGKVVAEALTVFRGAHRATCTVAAQLEPLPAVLGSPGALGQVLLNLLQNGLDAMGGKGELSLAARSLGDEIVLSVADRGPGIAPEARASLFEPFFTTKPSGVGTGLGLYICHQIVGELQGTLAYVSGAGGTTFTVTLPAATAEGSA